MNMDCIASKAISGWPTGPRREPILVGYFLGEGIGAEIVPPALELLSAACGRFGRHIELRAGGLIGKPALEASGKALTDEAVDFCTELFADGGVVLCGPGGSRFVYEMRARFDLYCKFTPLVPCPALRDTGCVRPQHVEGVDILAVRENTGGMYFGESTTTEDEERGIVETHRYSYSAAQVRRILVAAFAAATRRRRKVCVTIKPGGIPGISRLWKIHAEALSVETGVELTVLEIDNAVYQIIANPHAFDVVASSNMFGDVLADAGALLLGSRGMSYSGNFGAAGRAVYQTAHGAAYDIAGTDKGNPLGQVLSVAMMLRESLGLPEASDLICRAVTSVLERGFRTADIASSQSIVVGTKEMSRLLLEAVDKGV
jgi:3-isopropylmalate dehydrogenase